MKHVARFFIKLTGILSTLIFFKPRYIYEDKKVQKRKIKGGAVIAVKHRAALDFVLMLHVFYRRYLRCAVGEVIYEKNKFLGFMMRLLGSVKVDRPSKSPEFIGKAVDIAAKGGVVEIYPEGHFVPDDRILPFTESAALIAVQAGVKVIPVYHNANFGILKRVTVVIGKPIDPGEFTDGINPTRDELITMTKVLEQKMYELRDLAKGLGTSGEAQQEATQKNQI